MGLLQRARFRIRHAILARKLGGLGHHSVIDDPDMLTGTKGLFLGDHVTIRGHSRIECVLTPPYHGRMAGYVLVRNARETQAGQRLNLRFQDGKIEAEVKDKKSEE